MAEEKGSTGNISISVGGGINADQFAAGKDIQQTKVTVSQADLAALAQQLANLRSAVAQQAPADRKLEAVDQADKLKHAITAGTPNPSAMAAVRDWFVKNMPTMVGAVTTVIVNPIVGALVKAGGDVLVADFEGRFGPIPAAR